MSIEEKNKEFNDEFWIKRIIKMISELYNAEINLNNLLKNKNKKRENFILFDKKWLEKWKSLVAYDELKDKCKNLENIEEIKNEINELFIQLNTKKRLEELGPMSSIKLIKKKSNIFDKTHLNEIGNFIPIINTVDLYFTNYIKEKIGVNGVIFNGRMYIYDPIPEKSKEKKIIILFKENEENKEFKKYIIYLEQNANINNAINELNSIKNEELLNENFLKNRTFNTAKIIKIENAEDILRKIEEKVIKRLEEEIKILEEERKILEEEKEIKERKIKESEEGRLEEENKRKEEEKKKLEEERNKLENERIILKEEGKILEEERKKSEEEIY